MVQGQALGDNFLGVVGAALGRGARQGAEGDFGVAGVQVQRDAADRLHVPERAPGEAAAPDREVHDEVLDVELPDEEWDTVGGLMLGLMGSIPEEGEEVSYQTLRFTAEQVNGRRISKVLITREEAPEGAPDGQTQEEEARAE